MDVAVAGACGFVGSHLVPALQERGHRVVGIDHVPCGPADESVTADLGEDLPSASLADVDALYYLVHGLTGDGDLVARERGMARTVRAACDAADVDRIIYLGGIRPDRPRSAHLQARQATAEELGRADAALTEFQASIIVGQGSASFRIMRQLVERLPVMIGPRWLDNRMQPIHIADAVGYLADALDIDGTRDRTVEIGGADVLTYREGLAVVADELGRSLRFVPTPFLTPRLSAGWLRLFTDVDYHLARFLVASLVEDMIVRDPSGMALFDREPAGFREAVRRSLAEP